MAIVPYAFWGRGQLRVAVGNAVRNDVPLAEHGARGAHERVGERYVAPRPLLMFEGMRAHVGPDLVGRSPWLAHF